MSIEESKLIKDPNEQQIDEVEKSAMYFHAMSKTFRKAAYKLANRKKRAVIRVVEAFMFEPLEEVELFGKEEKELLGLMRQVMFHKNKLAEYAAKRHAENQKIEGENNEREQE